VAGTTGGPLLSLAPDGGAACSEAELSIARLTDEIEQVNL
jgi:hypothetical protein